MRKKYLLVKFENIKKKHVPLIAELRETCIYAAVYTEDKDIGDKEVITAIRPAYIFTLSDREKALDTLANANKLKLDDITVLDKLSEKAIRTERVRYMESLYDKALNGNASKTDIKILDKYLATGFKGDYEADEKGMFPQSLKRGVLSQDGLFDLLENMDG